MYEISYKSDSLYSVLKWCRVHGFLTKNQYRSMRGMIMSNRYAVDAYLIWHLNVDIKSNTVKCPECGTGILRKSVYSIKEKVITIKELITASGNIIMLSGSRVKIGILDPGQFSLYRRESKRRLEQIKQGIKWSDKN